MSENPWYVFKEVIRKAWGLKEGEKAFKGRYMAKFGLSKWPPSPQAMGWTELRLSAEEIEAASEVFAQARGDMYPSADEILEVVKGPLDKAIDESWCKIWDALATRTDPDLDEPFKQALEAVGGVWYLRGLTRQELRYIEQDYRRMAAYYWRKYWRRQP